MYSKESLESKEGKERLGKEKVVLIFSKRVLNFLPLRFLCICCTLRASSMF
jgi:hypothetical protein